MADLVVETRLVNGSPVLDLTGEVDSYNSPKLRDKMIALIDEISPNIIVNLTGVDYIDSTGLGTLVAGLKRATEKGGGIRIICPNEQIFKVFHITGLVRVFTIHQTEQSAFAC
ncbi:MAG: STAS domain-containing protein [Capsulimonadales bacterium]|nr:STAS domain-containing protein [Capsulimonadales bacterium]